MFNLNERFKLLDGLKDFIESSQDRLTNALNIVGWDLDTTKMDLVSCPINSGHRICPSRLDIHVKSCRFKSQGYYKDVFPDSHVESRHSIIIDKQKQNKIIVNAAKNNPNMKTGTLPDRDIVQSLERMQSDFTADERLAIYEYAIQNTEVEKVQDINLSINKKSTDKGTVKSVAETLAEKRDFKRRRTRYRKPAGAGYKDELRATIHTQMEIYEEWIKDQIMAETAPLKTEPCKSSSVDKHYKFNNKQISQYDMDDGGKSNERIGRYDRHYAGGLSHFKPSSSTHSRDRSEMSDYQERPTHSLHESVKRKPCDRSNEYDKRDSDRLRHKDKRQEGSHDKHSRREVSDTKIIDDREKKHKSHAYKRDKKKETFN